MRQIWAAFPILLVAACASEVAPTTSGVGFGNYEEYRAEQERQALARQQGVQPGMVVSPESTTTADIVIAQRPAEPELRPIDGEPAATDTPAQQVADAGGTIDPDNPTISDEQNFEAVSARESIESDRERLERQKANYQVIEPTALPRRRGDAGPNIVAFALSTTNSVGQPVYSRGPFKNANVTARNCARYLSPDRAQEAFLAAGGPARDPKRLDPDGDGFACDWDPAPFRVIRN